MNSGCRIPRKNNGICIRGCRICCKNDGNSTRGCRNPHKNSGICTRRFKSLAKATVFALRDAVSLIKIQVFAPGDAGASLKAMVFAFWDARISVLKNIVCSRRCRVPWYTITVFALVSDGDAAMPGSLTQTAPSHIKETNNYNNKPSTSYNDVSEIAFGLLTPLTQANCSYSSLLLMAVTQGNSGNLVIL